MNDLYLYLIFVPVSYIIGSINFATIIAKIKNKDIKKNGFRQPWHYEYAPLCWQILGLFDFRTRLCKGISFALIGMFVFKNSNLAMHVLGLSVVLGHIFSCFSKFKGGKGVATSLGAFAVITPIAFAVAFTLMIIYLAFSKKGFIGSLFAISVLVITNIVRNSIQRQEYYYICLVLLVVWWALIFWTHRANFKRIKNNTENSLSLFGKENNDNEKES